MQKENKYLSTRYSLFPWIPSHFMDIANGNQCMVRWALFSHCLSAVLVKLTLHCAISDSDSRDIKSVKKYPLTLRLAIIVITSFCGVCICYIRAGQETIGANSILVDIKGAKRSCSSSGIQASGVPYLHYPQPETFSREECGCNPVRFFTIVSMQRSGSGWFETLLNSHINISSNGEVFSIGKRRQNITSIFNTMDKVYNLDWFTSASKNECSAAVGFKWMLNQGLLEYHQEIEEYFNTRRVSLIFLFRRNLLRRMVSVLANIYDKDTKPLNGTHKSHVHSQKEAKILAKYKPRINIPSLVPELKQTEEAAAKAIAYFNSTRHIVLCYEDLVHNRTKLKDVQEFLRVPHRDLQSRQVKIHVAPLSKQIQNWDQVKKALKGTSYQSFLQSDY